MKLSKLTVVFLSLLISFRSMAAFDLGAEFDSMSTSLGGGATTTSPQQFRTATTRGAYLGSVTMRYPVKTINLVSVNRASFVSGCSGMDINFGGMSFIKGSEIIEYLKTISNGVPMLFFQMALKAIAAPVVDALNKIYDTMAKLSAALKNTCEASEALANSLLSVTKETDTYQSASAALGGMKGEATSWVSGQFSSVADSELVGTANKVFDGLAESAKSSCIMSALTLGLIDGAETKKECGGSESLEKTNERLRTSLASHSGYNTDSAAIVFADKLGNQTWNLLQSVGLAPSAKVTTGVGSALAGSRIFSYIMQGYIGTTVRIDGQPEKVLSGSVTPVQLYYTFLCGSKTRMVQSHTDMVNAGVSLENADWAVQFCINKLYNDSTANTDITVIACRDRTNNAWMDACKDPYEEKLSVVESTEGSMGRGMLFSALINLTTAVEKSMNGTVPFTAAERAIIAMAPFPLYKAVNVASSSPGVAHQLIQQNGTLLAMQMTAVFLNSTLQAARSGGISSGNFMYLSPQLARVISDTANSVSIVAGSEIASMDKFQKASEILMSHVNNINKQVFLSSVASGITGAEFAEALTKMTSN